MKTTKNESAIVETTSTVLYAVLKRKFTYVTKHINNPPPSFFKETKVSYPAGHRFRIGKRYDCKLLKDNSIDITIGYNQEPVIVPADLISFEEVTATKVTVTTKKQL